VSKAFTGNFFEDFSMGQMIQHGIPRTITEGDIVLYQALTGNRFVLNCAQTVAERCGFAHLPIDNFLVFHIAFGKTVPEISRNAVANLGYAECEFTVPAFVGDTLSVSSEVIGLKENSNGKTGIVYVCSTAINQRKETVAQWKRWVMVNKKDLSLLDHPAHIPQLNDYLAPTTASIPTQLDFSHFERNWSGHNELWQEFNVNEVIDHIDGLTINDSDHTLATHLYQNNASVHFNAHQMEKTKNGRRLVYGGHIISLCRSLTHNGLGNGLWISAIHAGTHANPSFSGDTIYAKSEIMGKGSFDNREDIGWLRIKTWGMKNITPSELSDVFEETQGRKRYKSNVVLELDYTVLMPKVGLLINL